MKKLLAFLFLSFSLNAFALDCTNLATIADKQAAIAGGCATPVISVYGYAVPARFNKLVSIMYDPNTNDPSISSGVYGNFWSDGQGNQVLAGTWRNYSSINNNTMVAWSSVAPASWTCPSGTGQSSYAGVCVPMTTSAAPGTYYNQPTTYCIDNPQYCGGDPTAALPTSGPVYSLLYPTPAPAPAPTTPTTAGPTPAPDGVAMTRSAVSAMQLTVLAMVVLLGLLLLAITFSHFVLRKGRRSASGKV